MLAVEGYCEPLQVEGKLNLSLLANESSSNIVPQEGSVEDIDLQESVPNTPRDAAQPTDVPSDSVNISMEMDMSMDDL